MVVLGIDIDIGGSAIKAATVNTDTGALLSERVRLATQDPWEPATKRSSAGSTTPAS